MFWRISSKLFSSFFMVLRVCPVAVDHDQFCAKIWILRVCHYGLVGGGVLGRSGPFLIFVVVDDAGCSGVYYYREGGYYYPSVLSFRRSNGGRCSGCWWCGSTWISAGVLVVILVVVGRGMELVWEYCCWS